VTAHKNNRTALPLVAVLLIAAQPISMSFSGYGSHLDEQFRLAANQVTGGKTGVALLVVMVSVCSYFYFYISTIACILVWAMLYAARRGVVSIPTARYVVYAAADFVPIILAIRTLWGIGPSFGVLPVVARLKLFTMIPILLGVLFRSPFWDHLLWSGLLTLGLVIFGFYRHLPADQLPIEVLTHVSMTLLALFVARMVENAHHENHRLRHIECTTILGAVSHDLRTPIHVAVAILEHLQSPKQSNLTLGSPQIKVQLARASLAGRRMMGHVDDLLFASASHITGGRHSMALTKKPVELKSFLQEILDQLRHQRDCSSVDLSLEISGLVPPVILADEGRLFQIVNNLLMNAAKFTKSGSIRIECSVESFSGGAEKPYTLKIAVADTGIGISPDGVMKLRSFSLFNQISSPESKQLNARGTGLGLHICHTIAAAFGGEIGLSSTPGIGEQSLDCMCNAHDAWLRVYLLTFNHHAPLMHSLALCREHLLGYAADCGWRDSKTHTGQLEREPGTARRMPRQYLRCQAAQRR
jgi:signal transduction histidine kinase